MEMPKPQSSPPKTPSPPPLRSHVDGAEIVGVGDLVVKRLVKEVSSSVRYPMLTRTNYGDWALLMRVNLQAAGLWEAIEPGCVEYREDRMALAAILQAVPSEMLATLAVKDTAKQAWDAIKTMRMGVERVREAKAQTLRGEFESMKFKDGESIDDFAMRLTGLVSNLQLLGNVIEDEVVVKKFLRVVPARYSQIAIAIETLVDLKTLTIEELIGRFKVVEERFEINDNDGGMLLMTKKEWCAKSKKKHQKEGISSGRKAMYHCGGKHEDYSEDSESDKETVERTGHYERCKHVMDRDLSRVRCFNCNKYGHFSRDCKESRKEHHAEANLAKMEEEDDEPTLL